MILSKKIRLKPTEEQEKQLWKSSGVARWAYNWALEKQEESYKDGGKFISHGVLRKELTKMKKTNEYSWLYDVSNNITKQAIKDLCEAYKRFFTGKSNKPKFKSRKHSKPTFYNDNERLKVKEESVIIEKVGWVKTAEKIPDSDKYTNPRINFDGKYWFISVGVETKAEIQQLTNESIGIDIGIKELAICSDGQVFKNINKTSIVKKIEKRLRMLQRKVSRKYEMNKIGTKFVKTKNIIKIEKKIKLLYRKLTNIRDNHIHQTTNAIVRTKPCRVVMEKLNVKGMMKNRHLSKSIAKQRFHDFKEKIKYKCEKYGIEFIEADMWYPSSKICSCCGNIKKDLKLSDRVYKCNCGNVIDRDLNAAINLSRYKLAE
ncbi:transposase [Bacillus cereus]|uniref:RNA-guided endonuclease InsQ/TnpB family protein n=1 Tax=Bacillus cereus TaxID=1396 RepID=UPI00283AA430|nr:transposase [Bacillus cereus]MCU4992360.1 transposase [Bacillus cereus]